MVSAWASVIRITEANKANFAVFCQNFMTNRKFPTGNSRWPWRERGTYVGDRWQQDKTMLLWVAVT